MTRFPMTLLDRSLALLAIALLSAACNTGLAAESSKPATPVDVNSADLKTLETLPGVGAATAKRIIDGRPYQSLSDLQKVKGLSGTKLEALKDLVTFGTASPPAASTAKKAKPHETTPASTPTAGATSKSTKPTETAEKLAPGQKLNINTASAEELDKLPGIGPSKANAIVNYRNQNGSFKTIEDIQKVKGIKEGLFAKIKDFIKVSN